MADDHDGATEERFLEAIRADPNDEASRLVYADWLEERGDERGEYLRIENQMWKIPTRIAELEGQLDPTWLTAVCRRVDLVIVSTPLKINAIKLIREITGVGLKEAKDVVDAMPSVVKGDLTFEEAKRLEARFVAECSAVIQLRHPSAPFASLPKQQPVGSCRVVLASCAFSEIGTRQRIEVLRAIRDVTGLGLAAARALAETAPAVLRDKLIMSEARRIEERFAGLAVEVRAES